MLIAIDGPSSSGKGTIAKMLAKYFNIPCLNTGALYRALAYLAINNRLNLEEDSDKIANLASQIDLNNLEADWLHNEQIGKFASIIAKNPLIRHSLLSLQKNFIIQSLKNNNGAVIEGRDIGTVICPEANYKFFITASAEQRAVRRYKQLTKKGQKVNYNTILSDLQARDTQDKNRTNSPLTKADDALEINTSELTANQVFDKCINYINNLDS